MRVFSSIRRLLLGAGLACLLLVAVLLLRTWRFTPVSLPPVAGRAPAPASDSALVHLRRVLTYRTISYGGNTPPDSAAFRALHTYLMRTYPRLHTTLKRELVGGLSLLYQWPGTNPTLKPLLLLAHQDVVPVEPGTASQWQVPPFAGLVRQGYIWGRGATDNKANLTAILEATEQLLASGYRPARTVYLAFGHDEEIGGQLGAKQIAALLARRGVQAEMVVDEGGFITTTRIPGLKGTPVALVGTAEKGFLSLELRARGPGGHSSMPEAETAIDVLAAALTRVRSHPFPADLSPSMQDFAAAVGPHLPFISRLAFANQWLLKPFILRTYAKTGAGNASIRTTIAPTLLLAGVKDNVVPSVATAIVNFRLAPGFTTAATLARVQEVIQDRRVQLRVVGYQSEPTGVSPTRSAAYDSLTRSIRATSPGVLVAPFLMVGVTDSRHYATLTPQIYKFSPLRDPIGLHGVNERLSLDSYARCLAFYTRLLSSCK